MADGIDAARPGVSQNKGSVRQGLNSRVFGLRILHFRPTVLQLSQQVPHKPPIEKSALGTAPFLPGCPKAVRIDDAHAFQCLSSSVYLQGATISLESTASGRVR